MGRAVGTWPCDDPRWRVYVLDTSRLTVHQTLPVVLEWVQLVRWKPTFLSPATRWWDASVGQSCRANPSH